MKKSPLLQSPQASYCILDTKNFHRVMAIAKPTQKSRTFSVDLTYPFYDEKHLCIIVYYSICSVKKTADRGVSSPHDEPTSPKKQGKPLKHKCINQKTELIYQRSGFLLSRSKISPPSAYEDQDLVWYF